jgi:hypothetical protein
MIHKLNKKKIIDYLLKQGWSSGINGEWIIPQNLNKEQYEDIWMQAVLQGIECELEQQKNSTQEFLKSHPTAKRV